MEILILRSNPVSPDSRVEKEAKALKELGYYVEIFCWDREKAYDVKSEKILDDILINRVGIQAGYSQGFKKNIFPLIKFQFSILKFLIKNRKRIKYIHACDFDTAFSAWIFTKICRKKLVYDIFDYYTDTESVPQKFKGLVRYFDKKIINTAEAVIICSEKRKKQIEGTKPKKLVVIHNTPLKLNIPNIKDSTGKRKKIVYVGVLLEKGRLLKELAEVVENNQETLELHIGGFGKLGDYFLEKSKKVSNIFFYGKISYEEVLMLENSCDIMVANYDPSIKNHYYAAPNKFYEALMLGKPLIMVKNTGMSEIVLENKIGEVIEYNKASLEAGLLRLATLENKQLKEISYKENELYDRNYSWNIMKERLKELYKKL